MRKKRRRNARQQKQQWRSGKQLAKAEDVPATPPRTIFVLQHSSSLVVPPLSPLFLLVVLFCWYPTGGAMPAPSPFPQHGHQPQQHQNIRLGSLLPNDADDENDADRAPPLVLTKLGKIRGFNQQFNGKIVRTFLGVPYARRPTGQLRFALPQMIEPWEGEFEATNSARTCFYPIDTMFPDFPGAEMWNPPNELDEDCLAMNIWVPEDNDGTVMVWIYGGGFYSGSPSLDLYDGRVLASHERTIVVNINYRLGAFGFLYLGDDSAAPGNMGLLDQQMALRWINENIDKFGGNPQKVTLFGESAGGASAAAHLFAPDSHRLFRALIAKSGAIMNNWATKPKAIIRDISMRLAQRLNCSTLTIAQHHSSSSMSSHHRQRRHRQRHQPKQHRWQRDTDEDGIGADQVIACMSRVPAQIIQRESDHISGSLLLPMNFAFVPIDEDPNFFRGNLFTKLRHKQFKKDVSIMLGTVQDEGTYWLPYYLHKYGFAFNHTISPEDQYNQALVTESQYTKAFDAFLPYFGNSQLVRHALMHAYASIAPDHNHANAVERWRDGVARFLGDYFFTCALIEFADVVADNIFGSVFMYYFVKRSSANPWPRWMGIMHGYEIEYVFGMPFRHPQAYDRKELDTEQAFSAKVMALWGRFARNSEPVEFWPKYNRITRKSLVLSEEIGRGNSHRIYVDVHGKLCRLLEEAQAMARLAPDQRLGQFSTRGPVPADAPVDQHDYVVGHGMGRLGLATASLDHHAWHRAPSPPQNLPSSAAEQRRSNNSPCLIITTFLASFFTLLLCDWSHNVIHLLSCSTNINFVCSSFM